MAGQAQVAQLGQGAFTLDSINKLLAGNFLLHNLSGDTSVNGSTAGRRLITYSAGALAMTLSAPVSGADDGKKISFLSTTSQAHTVTCTGHLIDGNGHSNTMTLGANPGAGFEIVAYQGNWYVTRANFATGS